MKRKLSLAFALCLVLVAFTPRGDPYFDVGMNLDIFATMFREVNAFYVDEVNPESLIHTGIHGMLETLDPYTDFIPEEDMEAFNIQTTGQYAGIGALITTLNQKNVVTHPYENFPAQRAGIKVGDELISIDGKSVKGMTTRETSVLLKGTPHSDVTVVVNRQGKELSFKLTREQIKINNVTYRGIVGNGIGYIRMEEFTPGAAKEVEVALAELKSQGANKFILDLRDNPGGLLHEAVNLVNLFVPKGKEIVSTRGKVKEWNKTYSTLNAPIDLQSPLVVLVNGSSASASEIVAGSLQDYDRGVLIGQRTFGKGLVQTTRQLPYQAQVKITTARYYIPSGRCIQALDYGHRAKDGSVKAFADSTKTAFKTSQGRTVFDGGGLDPDVALAREPYPSALIQLAESGLLFEFASKYCFEHPTLGSFQTFKLTDAEYKQFESWLKDKKFIYATELEKRANELLKQAKDRKSLQEWTPVLQSLKGKIEANHAGFLSRFRDEIQPMLEEEIGFHAGLHRGRVEVSFDHDHELEEAKKILADPAALQRLLTPH